MLPDIKTVELFRIGVLHISPFGVLAATGILTGRALALHRAKQAGIPEEDMDDALLYTLLSAFFFAHIAEAVFYHPDQIMRQGPVYLLKFWKGLSSFGGFFGGLFGFMFFVYRRKIRSPLLFAECILQGLVLGWIFGRLGCTIIFDHPGQLSDFFLAFQQPGGARHNLGFYEFLLTLLVLFPVTLVLHRLQARPGPISSSNSRPSTTPPASRPPARANCASRPTTDFLVLKALFALVTVASPLIMLAAAVRVFRQPYRNKWLWVILSFLGLATVTMDWATGQVMTQWATVNLIGFGITQTPPVTGAWILTFTIPIKQLAIAS